MFADGQSIAIKLHRQIQAAAKRRDALLSKYNALPQEVTTALYPLQLQKDHLMSHAIGMPDISGTNVDFPISVQKKCIELGYLYERAKEEVEMVKSSKPKLVERFTNQHDLLNEKLCELEHSLESTLGTENSDEDLPQNIRDEAQNIRGKISIVSDEIDRVRSKLISIKRRFQMEDHDLDSESNAMDEGTHDETDDIPAHEVRHFIEWYEETMPDEYNLAYDVNIN